MRLVALRMRAVVLLFLQEIFLIFFIVLETLAEDTIFLDNGGELGASAGAKVFKVAVETSNLVQGKLETKAVLIFFGCYRWRQGLLWLMRDVVGEMAVEVGSGIVGVEGVEGVEGGGQGRFRREDWRHCWEEKDDMDMETRKEWRVCRK